MAEWTVRCSASTKVEYWVASMVLRLEGLMVQPMALTMAAMMAVLDSKKVASLVYGSVAQMVER